MEEQTRFNNTVRSIAAASAAVLAMLANILGFSPAFVSATMIDLIAAAVCAVAAVYFAIKRLRETPPAA